MTRYTTRLRQLIDHPGVLAAPRVGDGAAARIAKQLGLQAVCLIGLATSAGIPARQQHYVSGKQYADG